MSLWGDYLEELLDVSFNGVSLQTIAGAQITDHDFDEMPEIRSSKNPISSAHRSITAGRYFVTKRARVNFAVAGEMREQQAILGRIKQLTQYKNRDVVLTFGVPVNAGASYDLTETRTVTFKDVNLVDADFNHNAARVRVITVEFAIDDPIGIGGTPQTLFSNADVTTASTTIDLSALDLQGTFQEQYPIFTIIVDSITNGSTPSFKIVNGLSELTISQEIFAGDELVIDTDAMKVTLNDELIDFAGNLPLITDPESDIILSNTFTARNLNIEVKINPRYI